MTDDSQLPDQRWVTMEAEQPSPSFEGYEAWATCVCGGQIRGEPFSAGDELSCDACGRAFRVQFTRIEGATRKHPTCPNCHVGMTKGQGYWCPDCNIGLKTAYIDTYADVIREYQIEEWTMNIREECEHSDNMWHTHGHGFETTLHHCHQCCSNCPACDCEGVACNCTPTGDPSPDPKQYTPRFDFYMLLRRTLDAEGRFDCAAEQRAIRTETQRPSHEWDDTGAFVESEVDSDETDE